RLTSTQAPSSKVTTRVPLGSSPALLSTSLPASDAIGVLSSKLGPSGSTLNQSPAHRDLPSPPRPTGALQRTGGLSAGNGRVGQAGRRRAPGSGVHFEI